MSASPKAGSSVVGIVMETSGVGSALGIGISLGRDDVTRTFDVVCAGGTSFVLDTVTTLVSVGTCTVSPGSDWLTETSCNKETVSDIQEGADVSRDVGIECVPSDTVLVP
ncbi:MAG: hypothetical protein K0U41_01800 [Gammaproteobacteria bacterium]|nr:hypothetical protein [Gammaproteobacteria bacterium]